MRIEIGNVGNRGTILIAVLFLAGLLGTFAAVATMSLNAGADATRSFAEAMRAEEAMRGAIEQVEGYSGGVGPPHSGVTVITLAQTTVAMSFQDEISRIDLNEAPPELLQGIFRVAGVEADEARTYAARIVDWRDADDKVSQGGGAEMAAYRAAGRLDGPRNGPFQHVAELALVLGLPARVAAAVAPYVTVASGNDKINPLLADPPVLLAIPGIKQDRILPFLQERQTANMTIKDVLFRLGDIEDYVTVDNSKAVRLTSVVKFGGRNERRFEAVVTTMPGDTEPYRILAWNTNPPARVRELH